jgi:hypothetical protein
MTLLPMATLAGGHQADGGLVERCAYEGCQVALQLRQTIDSHSPRFCAVQRRAARGVMIARPGL